MCYIRLTDIIIIETGCSPPCTCDAVATRVTPSRQHSGNGGSRLATAAVLQMAAVMKTAMVTSAVEAAAASIGRLDLDVNAHLPGTPHAFIVLVAAFAALSVAAAPTSFGALLQVQVQLACGLRDWAMMCPELGPTVKSHWKTATRLPQSPPFRL